MNEIFEYTKGVCLRAKAARASLGSLSGEAVDRLLNKIADGLIESAHHISLENEKDLIRAAECGIKDTMLDRLRFGEDRIRAAAESVRHIASLPSPIGQGECLVRPNGLKIERVRVPLGVVGMIYEARPNVTVDAAALCIKTGNCAVLRGGKEAIFTNIATVGVIKRVLSEMSVDEGAVSLIERTERESSIALMNMKGIVDVLIPRGSAALIKSVAENATVPCIETGAGNCHIYVSEDADIDMAIRIIDNAKTQRPSVCNAAESLVVSSSVAKVFLPRLYEALGDRVEFRVCDRCRVYMPECKAASDEDHYTEYNDYIMSVIMVDTDKEAIDHINAHSTSHSEAIITASFQRAETFMREIDSSCVYVNASTRFTDGGEFGFGAEIGISTQKLHARGPMGLYALTTEKYLVSGNGQIR